MQRTKEKNLSISQYAKLRGLNRSTVSRQVRSGIIPTHDGRIVASEADKAREHNLDPTRRQANALRKSTPKTPARQVTASELVDGPTAESILLDLGAICDGIPVILFRMGFSLDLAARVIDVLDAACLCGMHAAVEQTFGFGFGPGYSHDFDRMAELMGICEADLQRAYYDAFSDKAVEAWSEAAGKFLRGDVESLADLKPLFTAEKRGNKS